MQAKYIPLLKLMLESNTRMTASTLSDGCGISLRSVKSYVSELNKSFPGIISSSSKGYSIHSEIAAEALKETKSSIPQTARERAAYIINETVKHDQPVSFYDLCEELFISQSTLRSVFPRIRRQLEPYDLLLDVASDHISIHGTERNKRRLLSSLLYNESNENFVNLETIQNAFSDIDISFIKDTVVQILGEYCYFINDYSLSNLVLHIAIAADRIKNNIVQESNPLSDSMPQLLSHEYELSQKVIAHLEEYFQISFSPGEAQEMTLILISRATSLNYQSINADNLESFIGKECLELVNEMVNGIASYFYINLREPEFLIRFALHIKNLLIRARGERFTKNPLGNTIKSSCPLIYDHAVWCSSIIKSRTGLTISDDEIGYIAFHLGSTLEAQKELAAKLSTVIYCPTYYNMDKRLYESLNARFSTELMIANVVTEESDLDKISTPDFIIHTVPMNEVSSVPSIQIQPFLTEADITGIRQLIEEIRLTKKKETFTKYMRQIMSPEFFEHGEAFLSCEDAIEKMCRKFSDNGYVDESFQQDVFEREDMSSTAFTNFSIPHTVKMYAKRTGMYIYICDTPTDWHGVPVSLIILLCFNREERFIFNEIFEPLTMILTDNANFKKIISIDDYDELLNFLTECI